MGTWKQGTETRRRGRSTATDCWLRGSVGIYTHQPVSSRAAHGGGESLARLRWIRGDTLHVSHSCRLQEADRAHDAGPEVGTPPPANALSHTPSAASDSLACAATSSYTTGQWPQKRVDQRRLRTTQTTCARLSRQFSAAKRELRSPCGL